MKSRLKSPMRSRGHGRGLSLAAATLALGGWAACSYAEPAEGTNDQKAASEPEEVVVVGYKITRGSVGSMVDADVQDIPRNIVTVDEEALTNQMADNTLDILRNFPGVQRGNDAPGEEHPRVRGLLAFQFLEGIYSGGLLWDSAEFLSAAELLTGPSSVQFGFQSRGGGALNYRLKRPKSTRDLELTVQFNQWGNQKYVVDGNMPFGDAGEGLRVIGIHESISDYRRNLPDGERNAGALLLTKNILGFKSELDFEATKRSAPVPTIIQFFAGNPSAPFRDVNPRDSITQPWEHFDREGWRVGGKFSRDLVGSWRTVFTTSYESQEIDNKACVLRDPSPVTGIGFHRCTQFGFDAYLNRSARLDFLGDFNTFGVRHDVTVGVSQLRQHLQFPETFDRYLTGPQTVNSFYSPVVYPEPLVPSQQSQFNGLRTTQHITQGYVQDRMQFGEHWDLWAAVNRGSQKDETLDNTGLLSDVTSKAWSPSYSVSFSPKERLRFYVTYSDFVSPGGQAPIDPSYVNSGEEFDALRLKSTELGVKWQVGSISQLNLNVFDMDEPLVYTKQLAPDQFLYTRAGKSTYEGFEFTSTTLFPFGLNLNAGFTLLRPKQVDTGDPARDGQYVNGVSRRSAALYAEYTPPQLPKLGLTVNATYNSKAPLLATGGFNTGAYAVVDLGGFYNHSINDLDVTYRVMLTNALDERYFSPYGNAFNIGAPRTLMASFTLGFGGSNR